MDYQQIKDYADKITDDIDIVKDINTDSFSFNGIHYAKNINGVCISMPSHDVQDTKKFVQFVQDKKYKISKGIHITNKVNIWITF